MSHSKFSASASARWLACPGSMVLSKDLPNTSSPYAREGTAAHELAATVLTKGTMPSDHIGDVIVVEGEQFIVDEEMAQHVGRYVDLVRSIDGSLFVEVKVHYHSALVVEPDQAFGTADAIIVGGDTLTVCDMKFGRGDPVQAEDNSQMMLYAIGALGALEGLCDDITKVRMIIAQPRLNAYPEHTVTLAELRAFASRAADAVMRIDDAHEAFDPKVHLVVGEKQCRWCLAKATCPALVQTVIEEFDVEPSADADIGALMNKVGLIEDWCKAVRAEAERRLLAGTPVAGWKLVQGRRGNRAWANEAEVLEMMKNTFRLKDDIVYSRTLVSPAQAEKTIGKEYPRRWATLQKLITQSEGKPSVAPVSDPRPTLDIRPVVEDFKDET